MEELLTKKNRSNFLSPEKFDKKGSVGKMNFIKFNRVNLIKK